MIDSSIVEQHPDQPVVALDRGERGLHAREVPQIALVVRPVAGTLRADIDADGEMAGLRQTTAGCLPDQSVAAGDDRDLRHGFLPFESSDDALLREGRADPTALSIADHPGLALSRAPMVHATSGSEYVPESTPVAMSNDRMEPAQADCPAIIGNCGNPEAVAPSATIRSATLVPRRFGPRPWRA